MADESGQLCGTNKTIAGILGISESGVRDIYCDHKDEFEALSVAIGDAKEFLSENREVFGIKRVRSDMKIWSDNDILTFCYKATGPKSIEIRRQFTQFIKEHSRKTIITEEQYLAQQDQITQLQTKVDHMEHMQSKIDVMEETMKLIWKAKGFEATAGSYELHAAKYWKKASAANSL